MLRYSASPKLARDVYAISLQELAIDRFVKLYPRETWPQWMEKRARFNVSVDTLGLLWMVKVVAADTPEHEGAKQLLAQMHQERVRVPRLARIWFDAGFSGKISAIGY